MKYYAPPTLYAIIFIFLFSFFFSFLGKKKIRYTKDGYTFFV